MSLDFSTVRIYHPLFFCLGNNSPFCVPQQQSVLSVPIVSTLRCSNVKQLQSNQELQDSNRLNFLLAFNFLTRNTLWLVLEVIHSKNQNSRISQSIMHICYSFHKSKHATMKNRFIHMLYCFYRIANGPGLRSQIPAPL